MLKLKSLVVIIALAGLEQVTNPTRTRQVTPVRNIYEKYGRPFTVPLQDIVLRPASFSMPPMNVRVMGMVDPGPGPHFHLADGSFELLLIQAHGFDGARTMKGRPVEAVGVVRELHSDYRIFPCKATTVDGRRLCKACPEPLCDDPDLPMLPEKQMAGPRMSITVWSISEAIDFRPSESGQEATTTTILDIVGAPENWVDQDVSITGQFCGRGLCGPAPAGSLKDSDWLIERDDASIWVTGKKPEGTGWKLDPDYAGDTKWWLSVTGTVVMQGSTVAIRAKKLMLERSSPSGR